MLGDSCGTDTVASTALRVVEGLVGGPHQGRCIYFYPHVLIRIEGCHPERDASRQPCKLRWCLGGACSDSFCECSGSISGSVGREQREFIATYTCSYICHSKRLAHRVGYRSERAIADLVTVTIVDALEAIEIDDNERKGLA
jgi:hypothetical protein